MNATQRRQGMKSPEMTTELSEVFWSGWDARIHNVRQNNPYDEPGFESMDWDKHAHAWDDGWCSANNYMKYLK